MEYIVLCNKHVLLSCNLLAIVPAYSKNIGRAILLCDAIFLRLLNFHAEPSDDKVINNNDSTAGVCAWIANKIIHLFAEFYIAKSSLVRRSAMSIIK